MALEGIRGIPSVLMNTALQTEGWFSHTVHMHGEYKPVQLDYLTFSHIACTLLHSPCFPQVPSIVVQ